MILWHKRSLSEIGRVRREVEMSDSGLQFERSLYVASVAEELPSGTIVCSVHARSMPPNNNPIEYQMSPIIDTRSHAMFTIDSNSGLVTTLVSLDRYVMVFLVIEIQLNINKFFNLNFGRLENLAIKLIYQFFKLY